MNRLRIAVLGTGHLGKIHARLLHAREDVELVAVVDPVAEARDAVARDLGVPAMADCNALLSHIDAAVVAAPTQFHHALTSQLLDRPGGRSGIRRTPPQSRASGRACRAIQSGVSSLATAYRPATLL